MDRYAVFVDAGYFFAAGATAAFGQHTPRKQVVLKAASKMLRALCDEAAVAAGSLPLLRVYWYDAMPGPRLSLEQTGLALLDGIKIRLGALNSVGEQKGVDSLIVTDVIDLARNKAIAEAVIVTGDEDLRIAVQVAQSFGVRVHILAAGEADKNVSATLRMEADSVRSLDGEWFRSHLERTIAPSAMETPLPAANLPPSSGRMADADIGVVAASVIAETLSALGDAQREQLIAHFRASKTIPPEYDRPLIAKVSALLAGRRLLGEEMRSIRGLFVTAVRDEKKTD